jgi:hypothetical protein
MSSEAESSELSDDGLDEFLYFLTHFGRNIRLEARQNEENNLRQEVREKV